MADSIYTFDPVAANNTALDTIPYGPNQLYHNQIDNWFRALAAKLAQHVDDLGGVNTVAGTANAITATIASGITAYATGHLFWFKNTGGPNTTAATMNVNGIGAKEIRLQGDTALVGGELLDNGYYGLLYDAAYDGGDGGWVLLNVGGTTFATNAQAVTGTSTVLSVNPANLAYVTDGYATTATAAGTTTLTVASEPQQFFTGSTTQTVVLPVTSTLNLGRRFRIVNNSTGAVTVQSSGANAIVILAPGASGFFTCILTSGTTAASWDFRPIGITLGTAVASTSGTSIDFTGISAWAKKVTVSLNGVSTSGTSNVLFQLGDSGGVETSGYTAGVSVGATGPSITAAAYTTGFGSNTAGAVNLLYGSIVLTLVNAATNLWAAHGVLYGDASGTPFIVTIAGAKSLSATLDRVRATTVGGTDTFDAGSININYE